MVGVEPVAIDSTADLGARAIARVRRRLIPFLALLYFVAYLDRVNVGFAALQMNRALDLSPLDFGRGAGIFFLGYFLFEVPSNLALARIGARVWIARIAIVWGLVSIAAMFATGPRSFAALRFLLGAAEAGFFPGIVFYFTYWFPERERETSPRARAHTIRVGLLDPGVWRLAAVLFLIVTSGYGFSFFLPQIVKRLSGASDLAVGLWTAVPFLVAAIGMITIAAHSDRTAERRRHVAGCAALAALGLAASSFAGAPLPALAALALGAIGLYAATPPF